MSEINQEVNALVQADVDGVISADEKIRLQAYIDDNDDVRRFHADSVQLAQALDGMDALEPPAGLKESILAKQAERSQRRENAVEEADEQADSAWGSLLALWLNYPVLRYATAFLLGALLTSALSTQTADVSDDGALRTASVVGSMTPVPEFSLMESQRVDRQDMALQFDLLRSEQLLQLRFAIATDTPVELRVRYLAGVYQLFGFSQQKGALAGLNAGDGEVTLQSVGQQGFAVFLNRVAGGDRDIEVELSRDGDIIDTLKIFPQGGG